ncbi:unnamed protein product [Leptidea sinapis]|uniref:Ion transport domain-containing protein n=1 Tax=Leptidea sinapis TaxID=189913 RepID=A0A5E4QRP0_9NEOP|nr:unnamed protein product [Leptidea sinapis]
MLPLLKHEHHPNFITKQLRMKVKPEDNWARRQWRRVARVFGLRSDKGKKSKPADLFLDKFSAQDFQAADERPNQNKRSKWLCGFSFNPTLPTHYQWLAIVSLAILYNMVFVIGRSVFWEMDKGSSFWYIMDYTCDIIYVIDTVAHMHEGCIILRVWHMILMTPRLKCKATSDGASYTDTPVSIKCTSGVSINQPARDRIHSLCVENSPGLLQMSLEPRSKSLRMKK